MSFYDTFERLCQQNGISKTKAALEIGLSNATPTKWKKTGATPDGNTLAKIAEYFGVTADSLLNGEVSPPLSSVDRSESDTVFYSTLSSLCKARNESTYKVAQAVGLNRSAVAKWKSGSIPNGTTLEKIAKYFCVTTDALLSDDTHQTFSDRLRDLLSSTDATQADLSRNTGISESSISHYLKGDWEPKQDALYAIAKYLNVSADWLMGYSESDFSEDLNPNILMLVRASRNMTPDQAEHIRKYAQFMYPEAFDEE